MVFRPTDVCSPDGCGTVYEILLLRKPRKNDAWQLPQGGREQGENTEQAAMRELKEEAGIEAKVIGSSTLVYQYNFPPSYRRFRPDDICGQRIEFILALADKGVKVQVCGKEIDAYQWILPEQLPQFLKRKEYRKCAETLVEEGTKILREKYETSRS
jgi:8-oxo-dGTP pyrophosphatase MutT (NUDIX family)